MKLRLSILALLFFFGCGPGQKYQEYKEPDPIVIYNPSDVVWQGLATDRSDYAKMYYDVETCVGISTVAPIVTIIDTDMFVCSGEWHYGCAVWDHPQAGVYVSTVGMDYTLGRCLAEEYMHWVLKKDHGDPLFDEIYQRCIWQPQFTWD